MSEKQPATTATQLQVDDLRITEMQQIPAPQVLLEALPSGAHELITTARAQIQAVLQGQDDRLLLVIGPCSVHDVDAALEYAQKLREQARRVEDDLLVVMRVYFEKPRTTIGWKGLINDPHLNGTLDIAHGLHTGRDLLRRISALGLPCGAEFLDTVIPQYISDLVAWGAIGARTTESQIHRQLASGMSCPMGFKNGTDGNVNVAAAAVLAARQPHRFLAVTKAGECALASTTGNEDTHVILRGGTTGPNYSATHIAAAREVLAKSNLEELMMVDCSHANSSKDYRRQIPVMEDVAAQIAGGDASIFGLMVESNLVEGKQNLVLGKGLTYGQSVTDGCIGWDATVSLLDTLAAAVRTRRPHKS